MNKMKKKLSYLIILVLIPVITVGGAVIFGDKQFAWISLCVMLLSCVPFFISFEKREGNAASVMIIAVMTALSVLGRIAFAPVPSFKPVAAIVILTAMYFGSEAGFMTGALSAIISNFYFTQGPWTPFQMFSWGIVGLIAGLIAEPLKKSKLMLSLYGAFAGVLFSVLMDVWTVLWADGYFNISRYLAAIVSALPVTAVYVVSNIIFLLLLSKPIGNILQRIKTKYGI